MITIEKELDYHKKHLQLFLAFYGVTGNIVSSISHYIELLHTTVLH